jgi:stage V sporulation protein B
MKKQSLVKGALILTAASFITRMLVFSISIVESRVLGPEGIGLKKMAMSFLGLMMTLTTIGLPVAISKLVAEANTQGNRAKVKKILVVSLAITGSLSVIVVTLSILISKFGSSHFLNDSRSYFSFIALIPLIPIGAVSSVLKGYFRGMQNMNPIALSQVFEKIVQLILIYVLVQFLIPLGIEYAAAGAVLSGVIGEVFSLLVFIVMFKMDYHKKIRIPYPRWTHVIKGKTILFELLQTGLPTTGDGFIKSFSRALQPVVITKSLAIAGVGSAMIAKQYGMLTGYVMPILFLPGFINQSLRVTLVPALSEANAKNNQMLIQRRLNQAIGAALIVGTPSTVLLYLFAPELMAIIYRSPSAAPLLKLIVPFFLFNYLQTPLQSALVGVGLAKKAMLNNIIATGIMLALIYPLAANLGLGIYGVILAISFGIISETLLHYSCVVKAIDFHLDIKYVTKIIFAGLSMGFCSRILFISITQLKSIELYNLTLLASVLFSILIYIMLLGLLKIIHQHDVMRIPGIGKMLGAFFPT